MSARQKKPKDPAAEAAPPEPVAEPVAPPAAASEPEPPAAEPDPVAELTRRLHDAERRLALDAEDRDAIRASRAQLRTLESKALTTATAAKKAKQAYEAGIGAHLALEDQLLSGQQRLPLSDPDPESTAVRTGDGDDDWRDVSISELSISATTIERLQHAGILTIGGLANWTTPPPLGGGKRLTDIPGIGQTKAKAIEDGLTEFWDAQVADVPDMDDLDHDAVTDEFNDSFDRDLLDAPGRDDRSTVPFPAEF